MLRHVDFDEQPTIPGGDDGDLRPDARIHMPGGRSVGVDSKVPLEAYLKLVAATDADERDSLRAAHARQVRGHVAKLESKRYWEQMDGSPDFVVMFIPNDEVLLAAIDADPRLAEDVQRQRVVVATPMNLLALLRIIALGWREERLANNALEVERLGRELHQRFTAFARKLQTVGTRLGTLVKGYNEAVGSFERSLLPAARRFEEVGASSPDGDLPALEQVALDPRELRGHKTE